MPDAIEELEKGLGKKLYVPSEASAKQKAAFFFIIQNRVAALN